MEDVFCRCKSFSTLFANCCKLSPIIPLFPDFSTVCAAFRYFFSKSLKLSVLSSLKNFARSFSVCSSDASSSHLARVSATQRQLQSSAGSPKSPGYRAVLPLLLSNGLSVSRICPSSARCVGRVSPSSVASHCFTTSAPAALASCLASSEDVS